MQAEGGGNAARLTTFNTPGFTLMEPLVYAP
jgi:hypothetical protein